MFSILSFRAYSEKREKTTISQVYPDMTFCPVISTKSQALASQNEPLHLRALRLAREKEERLQQARAAQFTDCVPATRKAVSASGAQKRVDSFMSWEEQRKAKLVELKKVQDSNEMTACLFKPSTNSASRTSCVPNFDERLREDQRRRQERMQSLQVSLVAKETAECTYKPVTNLSKNVPFKLAKLDIGKRKPLPIANPLSIDEIFSLAREN